MIFFVNRNQYTKAFKNLQIIKFVFAWIFRMFKIPINVLIKMRTDT